MWITLGLDKKQGYDRLLIRKGQRYKHNKKTMEEEIQEHYADVKHLAKKFEKLKGVSLVDLPMKLPIDYWIKLDSITIEKLHEELNK